ncbi:MAG: YybS family protein [Erysipelotrichaceae bacterium]|nr:YybS family protein [Erysipelotrichaceae bacterium]
MGHTNTKRLVQGAMIASIFGVLSLLNTYMGGMIDVLICYVMVIPIVWYGYTYSIKDNIVVCIAAMVVIALMGLPFFVVSSFSSCVAGIFIGEALKREANKGTIFFGSFIVMFMNNILIYKVFSGLLGMNISEELTEVYEMLHPLMPSLSLNTVLSIEPVFLIVMSAMETYVILLFCQLALSRFKIEFPGSFHIASMHLNYKWGIVLLAVLLISFVATNIMHTYHMIFTYGYTLSFLIFMIEGLAFLSWLLIVLKKPKLMILAFIGILLPYIQYIYTVLGVIDIFTNLRYNIYYRKGMGS